MILAPGNYHPGDHLTPDMIERQMAEMRAYAPEMPGAAFYASGDPELARACDRLAKKLFVNPAPEVAISEPSFQVLLDTPHAAVCAEAKPKDGRALRRFRWFIDNCLMAETEEPKYAWNLRGEENGIHFITVHAVDSTYNRSAAQIAVDVRRGSQ
ncbi:MAG: hypothetical protein IT210_09045 [Armatimonadetes bacterium]|nr:hypothetical protein [Armatimonadota bacterium]